MSSDSDDDLEISDIVSEPAVPLVSSPSAPEVTSYDVQHVPVYAYTTILKSRSAAPNLFLTRSIFREAIFKAIYFQGWICRLAVRSTFKEIYF